MSKKTLNHTNLAALGADQLAQLLLEVSSGSADIKRRLRLELSHHLGAEELARDVRKRLASLRKSNSFVGWRRRKALVKDLATQHQMISDKIAPDNAPIALDLLWDFMELAPSIFGRTDDTKGEIAAVFDAALGNLAQVAPRAAPDPIMLADRVWTAILDNSCGEWDGVIALLAPALGTDGLAHLQSQVEAFADAPLNDQTQDKTHDNDQDHAAIQFLHQLRGGGSYAQTRKAQFVKSCLQQIATSLNDTDAYIAQFSTQDRRRKDISAEIAMLLVSDGQPDTALDTLLDADQDGAEAGQDAWDAAYIACLLALGRSEDAQDHRWVCFTETLAPDHLRAYLKSLPDFEDVEAEDRARRHVLTYPDHARALQFCLAWPDVLTAAQLVTTRPNDIDPRQTALLGQVADALRLRHPRAAVTLWRAMIDHILRGAITPLYALAADHLADCAAVDAQMPDDAETPSHAAYLHSLRAQQERKASFWAKVP